MSSSGRQDASKRGLSASLSTDVKSSSSSPEVGEPLLKKARASEGAFDVLKEARRLAVRFGFEETKLNTASKVVCFAPKRKDSDTKRINVYYTTRTVGTCVKHPKRGRTQLFRREVSKEDLARIFENPRAHTGDGYYKRSDASMDKTEAEAKSEQSATGSLTEEICEEIDAVGREEKEVLQEMAERIKWLDARKRQLQSQLKHAEADEKRAEEERRLAEERRIAEERRKEELRNAMYRERGSQYMVSPQMDSGVLSLFRLETAAFALGSRGSVVTVEDNGNSVCECAPEGLKTKLRHRDPKLPSAQCVAVGANGEWFVQFADGNTAYEPAVDERLSDLFYNLSADVSAFSFVEGRGYVVLAADGTCNHTLLYGSRFQKILDNDGPLDFASMSYDKGALFVRYADGKHDIYGGSDDLHNALHSIGQKNVIKKVVFGVSRNYWVVQYSANDSTESIVSSASFWSQNN